MINFSEDPHRRFNILTQEWVLVSPHRTKRPWQGKKEVVTNKIRPKYDSSCYLCPGNTRSNGAVNPAYTDTFSFTNDFAALNNNGRDDIFEDGLLKAKGEKGICKVLCFSPDHSLTIPQLDLVAIEKVISLWQKEYVELGAIDYINHVQIFENKGNIMGCSNPHPHGQIWAQSSIPGEANKKMNSQLEYLKSNKRNLLQDYLEKELALKERIVIQNNDFVTLVPFWAIWPYETMIISKRAIQNITEFTPNEKKSFAAILKSTTQVYDLIFDTSFPYSSGIHQAPTDGKNHPEWCMHMSFYPPLLRSATVKKFMVGYEMFGEAQRDISAETACEKMKHLAESLI